MLAIALFSTDSFSSQKTQSVIEPVIRYVAPTASDASIDLLNAFFRKLAHFGEYGLLAFLWCRAFLHSAHWKWLKAVVVSLVISCGWAVGDELHQTWVPSRTGSPIDVAIDASGAVSGIAILGWKRAGRS
jgi:VanZ family protein